MVSGGGGGKERGGWGGTGAGEVFSVSQWHIWRSGISRLLRQLCRGLGDTRGRTWAPPQPRMTAKVPAAAAQPPTWLLPLTRSSSAQHLRRLRVGDRVPLKYVVYRTCSSLKKSFFVCLTFGSFFFSCFFFVFFLLLRLFFSPLHSLLCLSSM